METESVQGDERFTALDFLTSLADSPVDVQWVVETALAARLFEVYRPVLWWSVDELSERSVAFLARTVGGGSLRLDTSDLVTGHALLLEWQAVLDQESGRNWLEARWAFLLMMTELVGTVTIGEHAEASYLADALEPGDGDDLDELVASAHEEELQSGLRRASLLPEEWTILTTSGFSEREVGQARNVLAITRHRHDAGLALDASAIWQEAQFGDDVPPSERELRPRRNGTTGSHPEVPPPDALIQRLAGLSLARSWEVKVACLDTLREAFRPTLSPPMDELCGATVDLLRRSLTPPPTGEGALTQDAWRAVVALFRPWKKYSQLAEDWEPTDGRAGLVKLFVLAVLDVTSMIRDMEPTLVRLVTTPLDTAAVGRAQARASDQGQAYRPQPSSTPASVLTPGFERDQTEHFLRQLQAAETSASEALTLPPDWWW